MALNSNPFAKDGYFGNIINSFLVGGATPLDALLGITDDQANSMRDKQDELYNSLVDQIDHDGFSSPDLSPNSADTVADEEGYIDTIIQRIEEATEKQNAAAQSSADRAMEFEAEQAEIDRQFQAAQAQKAMDYQTEMSNTAYQRAMADLQAAGLNPKLVAKLGAASSPSGVSASGTGGASGIVSNMSMQNISALAGVMEAYVTSAASLDRSENDFVQSVITALIGYFGVTKAAGIRKGA